MADHDEPREGPLHRPLGWLGQDDDLTERESQVLLLVADGLTNREIAETLFVNVETVRSHIKRAYQRLGLRNRAQAAAYVHRVLTAGGHGAGAWLHGRPAAQPMLLTDPDEVLDHVDTAAIIERLAMLGLAGHGRERLATFIPAEAELDAYAWRQIERWRGPADTARLLVDDRVAARLAEHQPRYLHDLFVAPYDRSHIAMMLHTGATHHRLHLSPQWYLASCVYLVCDHLPLFLTAQTSGQAGEGLEIEAVITLLNSVLFDAGLILDGYQIAFENELLQRVSGGAAPDPEPDRQAESWALLSAPRPLARISLTREDASSRLAFVGLGPAETVGIRLLAPVLNAAVPSILADFYALIASHDSLGELVPPELVDRLMVAVGRYWNELAEGTFDEPYAASRLRVGVIHERIGLPPQLYLTALALQVSLLLRAVAREPAPLEAIDALLRAVFFDLTFVLDAYLDARANALLQISRFATEVVAGLANGVAVVDQRNRIEYANEELLAIVTVIPGILHRLPLSSALPLSGIDDLVAAARADPAGRSTALYDLDGRRFRVTSIRLDNSLVDQAGRVALVVDDITDVLRAAAAIDHEQRRLDHVLSSLDALVWEIRRDDQTVLAASSGAPAVVGLRDVDLVGRPALIGRIHEADRAPFVALSLALKVGQRAETEHRLQRGDEVVWARTSMVATTDPAGLETICGVTVLLGASRSAPGLERFVDLLVEASRRSGIDRYQADPDDRLEGELFTLRAVEPGLLYLLGLDEPLVVPRQASDLAQIGWEIRGDLVRVARRWYLVAVDAVHD